MHDCPKCGQACYCDMEDHENPAPVNCQHDCDDDDDDGTQGTEFPFIPPPPSSMKINKAKFNIGDTVFIPDAVGILETRIKSIFYRDNAVSYYVAIGWYPEDSLHATMASAAMTFPP